MNSWTNYTPEERARRGAAISAGKIKEWASRKKPRPRCLVCGNFVGLPVAKYCSKACQHADPSWRRGPPRKKRAVCKTCGGIIEETRNRLYCTAKCHTDDPLFKEDMARGHAISWSPKIRIRRGQNARAPAGSRADSERAGPLARH
jgi:hypothetical protein